MTKVAAIIPSLASEETKPYLKLCVESLRSSGFDGQIIVVTNGGVLEPLNGINGISKRLHTKDQGQANAVNIGAQAADNTDYLFVVNDDMYFSPGWDKNLRFDYPVFSPNLVEPADNAGSAPPFLKLNGGFTLEEFDEEKVRIWIDRETHKEIGQEEPGFNFPLFIRKDLWTCINGYDVAYDPWGSNSDTDLQTKINLAGVTPMRLRDVLVYHFSNKSGTFDGTHQDYYQNNIDYFKEKFGFDRDSVEGCDVWYNKNMLPTDESKIKYKQAKYEE